MVGSTALFMEPTLYWCDEIISF